MAPEELAKALRDTVWVFDKYGMHNHAVLYRAAADLIEKQAKEIERLTEDLEWLQHERA